LKENGVDRREVLTTNVVLCYTDNPSREAIAACKPRLESELQHADTIILCGSEASKAIAGVRVTQGRGYSHEYRGARAIVTNNPAAALRDDSTFPNLVKDFRRAINPKEPEQFPTVRWTDDVTEALSWIAALRVIESCAVDIESTGLEHNAELVSIGFGRSDKALVLGHGTLRDTSVKRELGRLLSSTHHNFVYHNGKFDVKVLRTNGIGARIDEDSLLLSYVLDERPGSHDLDYLTADNLGWPDYTPAVVREGKKRGHWIGSEEELKAKYEMTWDEYKVIMYEYNGRDASGTYALYQKLAAQAQDDGKILDPYYRLLIPASNALADVEAYGVAFDASGAGDILRNEVLPELDYLNREAARISGREINLNSPKQLSEFYYDHLGLEHTLDRRGKERSTDAAVRAEIIDGRAMFGYENPAKLHGTSEQLGLFDDVGYSFTSVYDRFKKVDKIRSTYLEALIRQASKDGRIHATFNLHGTETGRLSGSKPNLQNQPRPTSGERLPNIRSLYRASPGYTLIQADYSQAELRMAAVLSGDEHLSNIYYTGRDFHSETCTNFYGPDFTKEQRVTAKTINFRILYGGEAYGFSQQLHIPVAEAQEYIDWWWRQFPDVKRFVRKSHRKILQEGVLESATGRKRRFHLITDENKHHTLKEGVNFLISSPASDLCLFSLIKMHDVPFIKVLLTVHDSILFETKTDQVKEAVPIIKNTMEWAAHALLGIDFPFKVDIATGERWGSLND
jgi:DNA polymerase-1